MTDRPTDIDSDARGAGADVPAPGNRREKPMVKVMKFLIPFVVTVGLCWVMFRDIDIHEMMHVIRTQCDFRWVGLMLVMSLVPVVLRGLRWGVQLDAVGVNAPVRVLIYAIFGTYAVNLVFPRLGEVWRSGYVSVREKAPFSTVFGAMIADRLADTLTVLLLTLATFIFARGPIVEFVKAYPDAYNKIWSLVTSPWLWGSAIAAGVAAWVVLARSQAAWVQSLRRFLRGLWEGFAGIAHMKGKMQWLGLTICIWGCYYLQMAVAFNAFPMTAALLAEHGALVVLVCFVLTSISMGIPSNGGIGPYQTTMLFGLALFFPMASSLTAPEAVGGVLEGMSREEFRTVGAAFGNVLIACQTLIFIVGGLVTFLLIAIDRKREAKLDGGSSPADTPAGM